MAGRRFLEGIAADSIDDGQYMNSEDDISNRNGGSSTSDEEAANVERYTSENARQASAHRKEEVGYTEKGNDEEAPPPAPVVRTRTRFYSSKLSSQRRIYARKFVINVFLLGSLSIAMFSLYWGALYNHEGHLKNVKFLAVLQDDGALTASLPSILENNPTTFDVYNSSSFLEKYGADVNVTDKVIELVHHRKYWGSLIAYPNATQSLVDSLTVAGSPEFVSTKYFEFIYESARDLTNFKSTILPQLLAVQESFRQYYYNDYFPKVLRNASSTIVSSGSAVSSAGNMEWKELDYRPFNDVILLGPMQVGLIYCILLTFFQLALFGPVHAMVTPLLKPHHIIIYRLISSWGTYFFLSLFFCVVSAIFHVDFTSAFGKGGFVIYWMSTWLLMGAVGGANENILSVLIAFSPQYLGFWLISWIILNISPSFVPMVLCNRLYRYGYMMPIFNGMEIYRVLFLNLYRGELGRSYGVLVAWCCLNTLLFPIVMKVVGQKFAKEAKKKAAQN